MNGYEAVSVPFLIREENQEELPLILSVQGMMDWLKKNANDFYGILYSISSEWTIKLKEKLRE